jgi:hypothetical protein
MRRTHSDHSRGGDPWPLRREDSLDPQAVPIQSAPDGLLQEVLCHEMAHLATRELHGRNVRPHGPEWKALMTSAGFEPRTRLPSPNGAPLPEEDTGPPTSTSTAAPSASSSEPRAASRAAWRRAACVA